MLYIKQLRREEFYGGKDIGEIAYVDSLKGHVLEVSCQNESNYILIIRTVVVITLLLSSSAL